MLGWGDSNRLERLQDVGLLLLRSGAGAMMLARHGWPKLVSFGSRMETFSDPLGVGPLPTLIVAVFAELVCSVLVIAGLYTRLAALPIVLTMLVAGLIHHAADPFKQKELPLLYAVCFITVACAGPGRFSVDHVFRRAR